ncbi:MAG: hypothetical protein K2Z80_05985 [Xanthobacteraceae bacterium]|nr:hypothetical protein [Xanthobacteraceae bacterium]
MSRVQAQTDVAPKIETPRQRVDLHYQFRLGVRVMQRQKLRRCVNRLISGVNFSESARARIILLQGLSQGLSYGEAQR